jgi:hypothetical protein
MTHDLNNSFAYTLRDLALLSVTKKARLINQYFLEFLFIQFVVDFRTCQRKLDV